ncbi:hypothetical protein F5X68DRAFT_210312 [Plectosphaerella plurivora]|uniref:CBF1-interacting co-repressor CIR N-terminal domain-containing protein n=1 Tax=Plectosphaerella plurivora TaxID=936078 RepID=A0A9P8V9F4_9PEZI|nr:hypothetical protein F5X68DRAFT_210312 [Plectosphaerella plurivora]
MPLHLLGKKSWNVYNADNIARVKRDEAAAQAAEEANEQRMQEVDAERRLAILRGEEPPPLPSPSEEDVASSSAKADRGGSGRERKKRKRTGEDDTDFELRLAMERSTQVQLSNQDATRKKTSDAPIVGRDGHIDLFGAADKAKHSGKNDEVEAEKRKAKKELEDQYMMRLSNAAGKDGVQNPWYSKDTSGSTELVTAESVGKDAFGREDPGRKKRDADRISANDPLAMMKRGAAKVREIKKEQRKFQEERSHELKQMQKEEKRRERHERERRHAGADDHHRHRDDRHGRHERRRRDESSGREAPLRDGSSSTRRGEERLDRSDRLAEEHTRRSSHSRRHRDESGRSSSRPSK